MRIIKPSYAFIEEPSITKKIERIARICYKSEDKIGEGTDSKMITTLLERQHLAMLEHGDVCMEVSKSVYDLVDKVIHDIENNLYEEPPYTSSKAYLRRTATSLANGNIRYVISGNIRAWYEFFLEAATLDALPIGMYTIVNEKLNNLLDTTPLVEIGIGVDEVWKFDQNTAEYRCVEDVSTLLPVERMVHETVSVLFTVDRGVTHEIVRMRDCSFAQESTRYCNYNLGKFGNEITVISPIFFESSGLLSNSIVYETWKHSCEVAEREYFKLLEYGATPQQARDVLPTSVKAEIVVTTNLREWRHILKLRACDSTGPAHPQMKEVMIPCLKELKPKYEFAFGDLIAADN